MEIVYLRPQDLIPYANNPRKNDKAVDAVAASIREFGFKVPIVVDSSHTVITGHTRLKAAFKLGLDRVPVIIADDLTEDQVKAYRLADNKVAEIAEWDLEALELELKDIKMDMSQFTFKLPDIKLEAQEDDYEVTLPEEPKSKYGDIYRLGKHRLMCGDATKLDDVEALMDLDTADMLLTDPPYNVDYEGTAGTMLNDKQEAAQFQDFLTGAFTAAATVMRKGAAFYIWHADSEGYNFRTACKRAGLQVRQCLIWNKNALVLGRQDYQWKHEPCLYGWKDGAAHFFVDDRTFSTVIEDRPDIAKMTKEQMRDMLRQLLSPTVPATVIDENKPAKNEDHPTMKPVRLMGRLINNSTKRGGLVLDLFGGSGSTLVAAEQLGRRCNIMELDPKYCDTIIDRYQKLTGDSAELISSQR